MKWPRQRCPLACNSLATAASIPYVRIRDHRLDAAQTAAGELAQERGPERLGFRGADVHAENLAPPVALLTPTATITATETMRPWLRTFTEVASIHR